MQAMHTAATDDDGRRVAVVIEDDADIRALLVTVLAQSGFDVFDAGSGAEGVELVRDRQPQICTLDVGLPDFDGFEAARRIRLVSDCYLIMVTALSDEADTLIGLESGADDYIVKPFRPRELRARVSAMMRRPRVGAAVGEGMPGAAGAVASGGDVGAAGPARIAGPSSTAGPAASATSASTSVGAESAAAEPASSDSRAVRSDVFVHGGLVVDTPAHTVENDGVRIDLTPTEFVILHHLLEGGRRVRSKSDFVRVIRSDDWAGAAFISQADERSVEVHLGNLRRKLGEDARSPRFIETVRGIGYRMTEAV